MGTEGLDGWGDAGEVVGQPGAPKVPGRGECCVCVVGCLVPGRMKVLLRKDGGL